MTKLEEEIKQAIPDYAINKVPDGYVDDIAKAAAEVAKRYIEKAYEEGWESYNRCQYKCEKLQEWLKENGVV